MDEKQTSNDQAAQAAGQTPTPETENPDVPEGAVEIPVEIVGENGDGSEGREDGAGEAEATDAREQTPEQQAEEAPTREALEQQVASLKEAYENLKKATEEELRDIRMRSQAELENFKKRLGREHSEHLKYAAENVMKELVPSLDNLELAITYGAKDEACKNLMQGVEMTRKLLLDAVGRHGLECVGKEGDPFDPALHEAIGTEKRDDLPPNVISRVLQSGYSLQGRILRPAKVMVNTQG